MPTRLDVAKLASVSPSTVSRVVNNRGYVDADVRKRVIQAIAELNYVPNRAARSLRLQRYRQIACIAPSVENPFYHAVLAGIEEVALETGYTFSWYSLRRERMDRLQVILEGFYDGIILLAPLEMADVDLQGLAKKYPLCLYSDRGRLESLPNVYVDLRSAMAQNIEYLIDCGHRRILFVGHEFTTPLETSRYQGYLDAFAKRGLEVCNDLVHLIPHDKDTISYGYDRVKELLGQRLEFTAIAAANDLVAVGAIRAVREAGLDVPSDISVTGVDDIDIASLISPGLTTIRIPKRQVGNELMKLLLKQIDGQTLSGKAVELPTQHVVRESVKNISRSV